MIQDNNIVITTNIDFIILFIGNIDNPKIMMKTGHNLANSAQSIVKSKTVTMSAITPIVMSTIPVIKPLSLLLSLLIVGSFLACINNHHNTDENQDERP